MQGIINFEAFLLAGFLLNIIPGADTMYVVGRSVSQGRRAGLYSVLGITTALVVHTLLVAFGLSLILTKSIIVFNIIKIIGVIYLVYLGIRMILDKSTARFEQENGVQLNVRKIYVQGFLTNITNPKVALFFIAFLPQFIDTSHSGPMPFIMLGLVFTCMGTLWCFFISNIATFFTQKLRGNPRATLILNKVTGVVFIAMGLKLLQTKQS